MPLGAGEYWALSAEQRAELNYPYALEFALKVERENPGYLASIGETAEEFARSFVGPGGSSSAAEGRLYGGCATREDLVELGFAPEQIQALLLKQQERACASST
jgi:hypothetical protein